MLNKLLCWLGLHDWEMLEHSTECHLIYTTEYEFKTGSELLKPPPISQIIDRHFNKKICLRDGCCTVKDEITTERNRILNRLIRKKERQAEAATILSHQ